MWPFRCPQCQRFLSNVIGTEDWRGGMTAHGICKAHGRVEADGDWGAEDFADSTPDTPEDKTTAT